MSSGQLAGKGEVLSLLFAYGNQMADEKERAALFIRLTSNFGLEEDKKWHQPQGQLLDEKLSSPAEVMVKIARECPAPRSHEQKTLLHQAARTLSLGVKDILQIERANPQLHLLEPAKKRATRPSTTAQQRRPKSSAMALTAKEPTLLARFASSCLILGACLLLLGLSLPISQDEVHGSGGIVFCTGSRGSPQRGTAQAMNRVGPFELLPKKKYILRVVSRPKKKEGRDTILQSRVAIIPRGKKRALTLQPLNETKRDGLFINFDIASFSVEEKGEFWCLVEAFAPALTLRGNVFIVTEESTLVGPIIAVVGFVLLFAGLVVFGLGHLRAE